MNFELVKSFLEKSTSGVPSDDIDSMPFRFFEPMIMSGLKVDLIERGRVLCSMKVPPRLLNVGNSLHGGATAALVDVVGSSVIMTIEKTTTTGVSVEINVSYLDAAYVGDEIEIEAKALRVGKAVAVVSVEFRNKKTGKIIAQGRHTKYLAVSNLVRYQSPKKPRQRSSSKMSRTSALGEYVSSSDARFSANSNCTPEDVTDMEEEDISLSEWSRQRKRKKPQLNQLTIMRRDAESRERFRMMTLTLLKSVEDKKAAILEEKLYLAKAKSFERDFQFFFQPHDHLSGGLSEIMLTRKQQLAELHGWKL